MRRLLYVLIALPFAVAIGFKLWPADAQVACPPGQATVPCLPFATEPLNPTDAFWGEQAGTKQITAQNILDSIGITANAAKIGANQFLRGPTSGAAGSYGWGTLNPADLAAGGIIVNTPVAGQCAIFNSVNTLTSGPCVSGGGGSVSITVGNGLLGTPNPIVGTGTLGLAAIPGGSLIGNSTGSSAVPTGQSLSSFLDGTVTTTNNCLLSRSGLWNCAFQVGTTGGTVGLNNANRTLAGSNTYSGTNTHNGIEIFAGPVRTPWLTKTGSYTFLSTDGQILCADVRAGVMTTTLDAAPQDGQTRVVKDCFRNANVFNFVIVANGGQTIEGAASRTFTSTGADAIMIWHNASSNWNLM